MSLPYIDDGDESGGVAKLIEEEMKLHKYEPLSELKNEEEGKPTTSGAIGGKKRKIEPDALTEYLSNTEMNLELLDNFGANAWLQHLQRLEEQEQVVSFLFLFFFFSSYI